MLIQKSGEPSRGGCMMESDAMSKGRWRADWLGRSVVRKPCSLLDDAGLEASFRDNKLAVAKVYFRSWNFMGPG